MNFPPLSGLRQNSHIPAWLTSNPTAVPYFEGQMLTFTLKSLGESDQNDAQCAVAAFLSLERKDRLAAGPYVFANYRRMAGLIGEEDLSCKIDSQDQVWVHVHPSEIFVSRRRRRDRVIYVEIMAECDWEREHGLQIIYRRGCELSRVSDQDGHLTHADAYNLPEDQDKIA
jgi:hypothetical protein